MKLLCLLFLSFSSFHFMLSQDLDSLGIENNNILNFSEIDYLNGTLKSQLGGFNFKGKKIVFAQGHNASELLTKQEYFTKVAVPCAEQEGCHLASCIVVLNPKEKKISGGFDAIVIAWSKVCLTNKRKKKILMQLGKN